MAGKRVPGWAPSFLRREGRVKGDEITEQPCFLAAMKSEGKRLKWACGGQELRQGPCNTWAAHSKTALSLSTKPHLHTHAEEQPPQPLQLPKAHFISIQFSLQLCLAPSCHAGGSQLS